MVLLREETRVTGENPPIHQETTNHLKHQRLELIIVHRSQDWQDKTFTNEARWTAENRSKLPHSKKDNISTILSYLSGLHFGYHVCQALSISGLFAYVVTSL